MGRSGSSLELCVIKRGKNTIEEADYCIRLGTAVAPRIHAIEEDAYVMEHLKTCPLMSDLPIIVEHTLSEMVWSNNPVDCRSDWATQLYNTTNIITPHWAHNTEQCLIHGDPTFANVMLRSKNVNIGQYILCDPVPPGRRVPQIREIDQAKIVQSMMGWETMIGGMCLPDGKIWLAPNFLSDATKTHCKRLMFWIGVTMVRCQQHLNIEVSNIDVEAWEWCEHIKKEMFRAIGI